MFVWKRSWFIVDSSVTFWHRTCSKNALVEHARPWCLGPAKDQFSGAFVCFATFSCEKHGSCVCFTTFSCKNVASWWGFFRVPPHFCCAGSIFSCFCACFATCSRESVADLWRIQAQRFDPGSQLNMLARLPAKDQFSFAFVCFATFSYENKT